jgi:hypothetical protein
MTPPNEQAGDDSRRHPPCRCSHGASRTGSDLVVRTATFFSRRPVAGSTLGSLFGRKNITSGRPLSWVR